MTRKPLQFSVEEFCAAIGDYEATWRITDGTLYRLCRDNFGHHDAPAVYAKLWIIGRTYATGIERKIRTRRTQGSSLTQAARHLLTNGKEVDELLRRLTSICEPLRAECLPTILEVHGRFTELIGRITRNNQSPRSFVSKYLHFHCPAVPIYDSIAAGVLPKLVRWHDSLMLFKREKCFDPTYCWYVMRFWKLYQDARAVGLDGQLKVKHLDHYLLSKAPPLREAHLQRG